MATTINSYSVGFGMDASSYIQGAKLSRTETRALIKDIEGARTPTEKYAREQDRLTKAYREGAIDLRTYNRLLGEKRNQFGITSASTNLYSAALKGVAIAGTAALASGVALVRHLRNVQAEIDETVKAAAKLGVTFNDLSQLRFAAGEIGGMEAATVDKGLQKMLINISKAVDGDPTAREAFERLGIDAGELIQMGPVDAVLAISDAMQGVNSQAERLELAMDVFGKSGVEFVDTLGAGRAAIQESADFQEKWNSLTVAQTMGVEANNDAWGRVFVMVEGISNKLAAEFAPAMQLVADYIIDSGDGLDDVDGAVRAVVDTTVYLAGVFKDLYELSNLMSTTLYNIATLDFAGVVEGVSDALDFSSGEKALQALYDKRFELDQAAAKKQQELDERRMKLQEEGEEGSADKMNEAEKERLRLLEQEENRRQQMAKSAIEAARKEFDEREKRQKQLQADIAKGPGGGFEEGSSEAARFLADQANAAIGEMAMPEAPTPGETELLAEARKQLELAQDQTTKMDDQINLLRQLVNQPKIELAKAR